MLPLGAVPQGASADMLPDAEESRRRKWRRRGLPGVVEGLVLLNHARSSDYCDRHDKLACKCGSLTSAVDCEGQVGEDDNSGTDNEEVHLAHATEDVLHLARLLQDPDDAEAPSG